MDVTGPGRRIALLLCGLALVLTGCAGRMRPAAAPPPGPPAGAAAGSIADASFVATAYCQGTRTATGTPPDEQTIAADPDVLPLGSRIRLAGLDAPFRGLNRTYRVGDTGGSIQGRRLDIYMRSCDAARRFGRQTVRVTVIR